MLAANLGGETGGQGHLAAFHPLDRPRRLASPPKATVDHEEKSSCRRYWRHARETAHVAARPTQICFRTENDSERNDHEDQAKRARLALCCDLDWISGASPRRPHRQGTETSWQRLGRIGFCQSAPQT